MTTDVFKALVLGPKNVGKTSLIRRHLTGEFVSGYTATVGVDMNVTTLEFPTGRIVLSVVDLGGQQSFASLRNRFYHRAHHVILVYDVGDRNTFDVIPNWFKGIVNGICLPEGDAISGSLVANKVDVENRFVTIEEGKQLADLLVMEYFETSAKTGLNVAELFIHAAQEAKNSHLRRAGILKKSS